MEGVGDYQKSSDTIRSLAMSCLQQRPMTGSVEPPLWIHSQPVHLLNSPHDLRHHPQLCVWGGGHHLAYGLLIINYFLTCKRGHLVRTPRSVTVMSTSSSKHGTQLLKVKGRVDVRACALECYIPTCIADPPKSGQPLYNHKDIDIERLQSVCKYV